MKKNDPLDPSKLASEDTIRALLPPECYTYHQGQLLINAEGLAALCIGILTGRLAGNKASAQAMLDQLGIENPFPNA